MITNGRRSESVQRICEFQSNNLLLTSLKTCHAFQSWGRGNSLAMESRPAVNRVVWASEPIADASDDASGWRRPPPNRSLSTEATKLLKRSSLKLWCPLGLLQLSSERGVAPPSSPEDLSSASVAHSTGNTSEAKGWVAVSPGVSAGASLPPAEPADFLAGVQETGVWDSSKKLLK